MESQELETLRKRAKISRQELADRLGVSYATVQRLEESRFPVPERYEDRCLKALQDIAQERASDLVAAGGPS